tara:strand:+ start:269 stop:1039 length:771 start_codon:yes stop_codon:yes gene_type:complete
MMEIYTVDHPTKTKLEEVCRLKQPIKFLFDEIDVFKNLNLDVLFKTIPHQGINVRKNTIEDDENEIYQMVNLIDAEALLKNDSNFYTENNDKFIRDLGIFSEIKEKMEFFRPPLNFRETYDFLTGSNNTHTCLKYNIDFRSFYLVTSGEAKIKLINPNSADELDIYKDYLNMEFLSSFNPWDSSIPRKADSIEVTVKVGEVCFIPTYWLYSIQFGEKTSIMSVKYNTYMSEFANLREYFVHFLQKQNTSFKLLKTE